MRNALQCLPELDKLAGQGRLLIATDFDGTLCPIADTPWAVEVPLATHELLWEMTVFRSASLAVISGRSLVDLATRVPWPATLAGNCGLEVHGPGFRYEHPTAVLMRDEVAAARERAAEAVARWPSAWVEDKGLTATVHYRAVPPGEHHALVMAVRRSVAHSAGRLALRAGKKAIEIHPRCGWTKGDALTWIKAQLGLENATCLCFGDERLDEPMFAANQNGINIRVGHSGGTGAQYCVRDPLELIGVLAHLTRTLPRVAAAAQSAAASAQRALELQSSVPEAGRPG